MIKTLINPDNIPQELKDINHWVVWLYEDCGSKKPKKIPYGVNPKRKADVSDKTTWSTYDEVIQAYSKHHNINGIGFVFDGSEGIIGIDVDGKIDIDLIDRFDSYSELTPSKNGCRIYIKSDCAVPHKKFHLNDCDIEIYKEKRYFTFTGDVLNNACTIYDKSIEFESFYQSLLDAKTLLSKNTGGCDRKDSSHLALSLDDKALLKKIFKFDKYGNLQKRRYEGDIPDCDYHMTDKGLQPNDSTTRYYLIRCFWNWTKDKDRVLRLMKSSNIYDESWERPSNGVTFIEDDINRIVGKCGV